MNAADFEAKGARHKRAFQVLIEGCDVPPSLEVFEHELAEGRLRSSGLSPEGLAARLAAGYHPHRGLGQGMP